MNKFLQVVVEIVAVPIFTGCNLWQRESTPAATPTPQPQTEILTLTENLLESFPFPTVPPKSDDFPESVPSSDIPPLPENPLESFEIPSPSESEILEISLPSSYHLLLFLRPYLLFLSNPPNPRQPLLSPLP